METQFIYNPLTQDLLTSVFSFTQKHLMETEKLSISRQYCLLGTCIEFYDTIPCCESTLNILIGRNTKSKRALISIDDVRKQYLNELSSTSKSAFEFAKLHLTYQGKLQPIQSMHLNYKCILLHLILFLFKIKYESNSHIISVKLFNPQKLKKDEYYKEDSYI